MAVNPRSPSIVVVGSNTNYGAPLAGAYPDGFFRSDNTGLSFDAESAPIVPPFTTQADPTVAIDGNGTVFFSFLGETSNYCGGGTSAVTITHSIDAGRSFRGTRIVDSNSADDKPNLAVRSFPHRRSAVFLTWSRFHDAADTSDVWFARSLDGGVTFRRSLLASSRGNNIATVPVVAPDGRVYVFWDQFPDRPDSKGGPARILFRSSTDDGGHFAATRVAAYPFTQLPLVESPDALRNLDVPAVVADPRGVLYLSWPAVTRGRVDGRPSDDILLSRSTDGGRRWSRPLVVNDAVVGDRFMPAMTKLSDGNVGIVFYDRRRGAGDLDVYAVRASYHQGWHISANVRLNNGPSPVADIQYIPPGSTCFIPGRFFGDYIGVAAGPGGTLLAVWTDTQLQVAGETDIWFARLHWSLGL